MEYTVVVEPEALSDLKNIYQYILKQDSKTKATTFINELHKIMASLNIMPNRCRKSYYLDKQNTKDLIYKGYSIVFQIRTTNVHVLAIFRQKSF